MNTEVLLVRGHGGAPHRIPSFTYAEGGGAGPQGSRLPGSRPPRRRAMRSGGGR